VEEPTVVNLLGRDPPVRQPVHLVFQQLVELVEAPRLAPGAAERRDVLVDERAEPRAPLAEPLQPTLDDLLLAADQLDLLGLAEPAGGEAAGGAADAQVLQHILIVVVEPRMELPGAAVADGGIRPGPERAQPVPIPDPDAP